MSKTNLFSALQLTLTPSSGIASIALDVSNPKQRNKGHMSHMLGSHASSASPAKVTSCQSPASTALKEASQTRSTRRTDKCIVDRKAKRCQKQRYAKINKIMNLMNLMCFGWILNETNADGSFSTSEGCRSRPKRRRLNAQTTSGLCSRLCVSVLPNARKTPSNMLEMQSLYHVKKTFKIWVSEWLKAAAPLFFTGQGHAVAELQEVKLQGRPWEVNWHDNGLGRIFWNLVKLFEKPQLHSSNFSRFQLLVPQL